MKIDFAPMQGITDAMYRKIHHECFPGIDRYFTPFVSPTQNDPMTRKELRDVDPANNSSLIVIPQIIASDPERFLDAARTLYDMGYNEVNLNLGCPSGTVTAKHKGAGLLTSLSMLELFLDEIYAHCPAKISIKTRLGWSEPAEFSALLDLYNQYPVQSLTIHGRTRSQFYEGHANTAAVIAALPACRMPVFYNGDLFTADIAVSLLNEHAGFAGVMIGRGLVANPALAREACGGEKLTRDELVRFHGMLYAAYQETFDRNAVLGRMREISKHFAGCFEEPQKALKKLRKASNLHLYEDAMSMLFDLPMQNVCGFDPSL